MSVIRVLLIVFTLSVAALSLVTMVGCEREASAEDRLAARLAAREARQAEREAERRARDEERRRWQEEFDQHMNAPLEEVEAAEPVEVQDPPPRRRRRVRRFRWESPAETRGKIWNVPEAESADATLTAFLRVCIAEADGHPQDCVGIWQVVKNNRRRSCDRGMIRRITECDDDGETFLSSLRRHQRHVLGYIKARNRRAAWIANLEPDCEMPEGWPHGEDRWDAAYGAKTCPNTVALGRTLMEGKLPPSVPGHRVRWLPGRPITWGGRCETGKAACDDRIACARGLARIPDTDTLNAFWCRPGTRGCRSDPEPICQQMGYTQVPDPEPVEQPSDTVASAETDVVASDG